MYQKCEYCGSVYDEPNNTCPYCGARGSASIISTSFLKRKEKSDEMTNKENEEGQKKKLSNTSLIFIILFSVIFLVGVIFMFSSFAEINETKESIMYAATDTAYGLPSGWLK